MVAVFLDMDILHHHELNLYITVLMTISDFLEMDMLHYNEYILYTTVLITIAQLLKHNRVSGYIFNL